MANHIFYNTRDLLKENLINLFQETDWKKKIETFYPGSRVDIIWIMSDLVKEKKYIQEALEIAKVYVNDPNPSIDDTVNKDLLAGKETSYIVTTRGSLCWLLNAIVASLNPIYYTDVINLLEKLAKDKVHYVRQQATYPLSGLMLNIRALNDNEGNPWNFSEEDKKRVVRLAYNMITENKDYPRVMGNLLHVFDTRRFIDEKEAMLILNSFLYQKDKEFYPDYVLHDIAPLLIFFAEFSKDHDSNFKDQEFQNLLKEVILSAPVGLKTTIVWHMWKTIEDDSRTYIRFKKYLPLFFEGEFKEESLTQYEFFIEKIMTHYPNDAVEFFIAEIEYIKRGLEKITSEPGGRFLFLNAQRLVELVAETRPEKLYDILFVLKEIALRGRYIGDIPEIFSSYKKAPEKLQKELADRIDPLYEEIKVRISKVIPLT